MPVCSPFPREAYKHCFALPPSTTILLSYGNADPGTFTDSQRTCALAKGHGGCRVLGDAYDHLLQAYAHGKKLTEDPENIVGLL